MNDMCILMQIFKMKNSYFSKVNIQYVIGRMMDNVCFLTVNELMRHQDLFWKIVCRYFHVYSIMNFIISIQFFVTVADS